MGRQTHTTVLVPISFIGARHATPYMVLIQLAGSGGWVEAELTEEQAAKSKLVPNIDKHFLASLERLDQSAMKRHFCKHCAAEFGGPAAVRVEEAPNEQVADGLVLVERGQYVCQKCSSTIGEYRVFARQG